MTYIARVAFVEDFYSETVQQTAVVERLLSAAHLAAATVSWRGDVVVQLSPSKE